MREDAVHEAADDDRGPPRRVAGAPDPLLREANDAIVRPLAVALCDLDYPIVAARRRSRPNRARARVRGGVVQAAT